VSFILKQMDTRSAEILSALLSIVIAIGMFTSPESALIIQTLNQANMLPEWAIVNAVVAAFCLAANFFGGGRFESAARFMSGCLWGTIVLVFANAQQWLPIFWIATVMFAFDIYLVTTKGQLWTKGKSSTPGG